MSYNSSKSTKRFTYTVNRNNTAKRAGSNTVSIATNPSDGDSYNVGASSITMTVREAQALRGFLNDKLTDEVYTG
jgi:hypothetical protein|tara:strand:+ start:1176 stop:1400 length:225 start_codon:yes stop_codon:yes gene_type:complete